MGTTIAALSTAPVTSGVGVIRLSGPEAVAVADKMFHMKHLCLETVPPRTACYGVIRDGEERLDDALATVFRAPASYTGEDVVELSCHGGVFLLRKILSLLYRLGVEPAQPGEFTKRAFLNGKLDLLEAEAVADLLSAEGDRALRAANSQRTGALSRRADMVADQLVLWAAHLAAVIDFPEEGVEDIDLPGMTSSLAAAEKELKRLEGTFGAARTVKEGVTLAIVGRPNVGKSSILNLLAGEDRAIVTEIAGTTRDVVGERIVIDGVPVTLLDTAGIRVTDDRIEEEGVRRSLSTIETADMVFAVFDGSVPPTAEDARLKNLLSGRDGVITIVNKVDLPLSPDAPEGVHLSTVTGEGADTLLRKAAEHFQLNGFQPEAGAVMNERQLACIRRAADAVMRCKAALSAGMTPDAVSMELECALDALYELSGKRASETIIDGVFSRFCVGK